MEYGEKARSRYSAALKIQGKSLVEVRVPYKRLALYDWRIARSSERELEPEALKVPAWIGPAGGEEAVFRCYLKNSFASQLFKFVVATLSRQRSSRLCTNSIQDFS